MWKKACRIPLSVPGWFAPPRTTPTRAAKPIAVQVQLKITDIDLKNNQLTFQGPAGNKKVLDVEKPEVQARLKDLKVGQSVVVTYTDVLQVTTQHEG